MEFDDQRTCQQCEGLETAWQILNDAAIELAALIATLPPDIYISLRGAKDLIGLCKSHPNLVDLTPGAIDSREGFCVGCCGSDIVARIECELRSVEDLLFLKAMNEVGCTEALELQEKTMKAWQSADPLLEEMKSKRKEAIELITKGIKDTQNQRRIISAELRKSGPMTIQELEQATGIGAKPILQHLIAMRKNGDITEVGQRNDGYVYVLIKGK